MKNTIFYIIIIQFLVSCVPVNYSASCVGTVVFLSPSHSAGAPPDPVFEYKVNGRMYRAVGKDWPSTVVGAKFKIIYDSIHPEDSKVLMDQPLFLPEERFLTAVGTIIKVRKKWIEFSYTLSGHNYLKYLVVTEETFFKYPTIMIGAKFEVKYSPYDHKRVVMYFDKPIND